MFRTGEHTGNTSGFCPGYVQCNMVILPKDWANEFLQFCQKNPKPCPVLGMSDPGSWEIPELAANLDIRSDLPSYKIFEHGEVVNEVNERPFLPADAIRAIQICTRFPSVHGAPVHLGDPSMIGIQDINNPEFGDAVTIHENELPLFWACGVTPQVALEQAKPPFCITHSPGCMLVTDIQNSKLAVM